jgi:predicted PurR-regulated permease PerM
MQYDIRSFFNDETLTLTLGVFLFLLLVPVVKLLRRTGHNAAWSLLSIIPGLNVIAFWLFAFKPWPTGKTRAGSQT